MRHTIDGRDLAFLAEVADDKEQPRFNRIVAAEIMAAYGDTGWTTCPKLNTACIRNCDQSANPHKGPLCKAQPKDEI